MNNVIIKPNFTQSNNSTDYNHMVCGASILDLCSRSPKRSTPAFLTVMAIMSTILSLESEAVNTKDIVANNSSATYTIKPNEKINYTHVLSRLHLLSQLNDGWNNDVCALKISPLTIKKVKQFVAHIDDQWLEGWNVFPCTNGSVIMDLAKNNIVDATINFAENGVSAFVKTKVDFFSIDNVPYTDESIKSLFEKVFYTKNICVKFLK